MVEIETTWVMGNTRRHLDNTKTPVKNHNLNSKQDKTDDIWKANYDKISTKNTSYCRQSKNVDILSECIKFLQFGNWICVLSVKSDNEP